MASYEKTKARLADVLDARKKDRAAARINEVLAKKQPKQLPHNNLNHIKTYNPSLGEERAFITPESSYADRLDIKKTVDDHNRWADMVNDAVMETMRDPKAAAQDYGTRKLAEQTEFGKRQFMRPLGNTDTKEDSGLTREEIKAYDIVKGKTEINNIKDDIDSVANRITGRISYITNRMDQLMKDYQRGYDQFGQPVEGELYQNKEYYDLREEKKALYKEWNAIYEKYGAEHLGNVDEILAKKKSEYKTAEKYKDRYLLEDEALASPEIDKYYSQFKLTSNGKMDGLYSYMDENELKVYAYHHMKYGSEKAEQYFNTIKDELEIREAKAKAAEIDGKWYELPYDFAAGIGTGAAKLGGVWDAFRGREKTIDYPQSTYVSQYLRSNDTGAWGVATNVASTVGEMVPVIGASVISNLIAPGSGAYVGPALTGASAMSGAYSEMIELGYSPDSARTYGLLVGAAEATLEKFLGGISTFAKGGKSSLTRIFSPALNKAFTKLSVTHPKLWEAVKGVGKVAGSMGSEAIEEGLQTALEPVFKAYATGEEFKAAELEEILYSSLLGALSGGVFEVAPLAAKGTTHMVGETVRGFSGNDAVTKYMKDKLLANSNIGQIDSKSANVQYSFREKTIPTYEQLISKPDINVVDIGGEDFSRPFKEQRDEIKNGDYSKDLYSAPIINRDTGEQIFITPASITHSFSNEGKYKTNAIKHIREIIENAVLTHAEQATHGADNTMGVYTLFAAVGTPEGTKPVRIKIKEYAYSDKHAPQNVKDYYNQNNVKDTYASVYDNKVLVVEEIETEDVSSSAPPYDGNIPSDRKHPSTSSTISIANLIRLVNSEYQKYLPAPTIKTSENLDIFSDTYGMFDDGEVEQMHAWAREDISHDMGTTNTVSTSESDIHVKTPMEEYQRTGKYIPDTAQMQLRKIKAESAKTETAKTGYLAGASESDIAIAEFVSKVFGRKILFMSDSYRINGKVEDGVIYINVNGESVASQALAHELTHTIETARQYLQLVREIKRMYAAQGKNWPELRDEIMASGYVEFYKDQGREFTAADADREIVADAIGEMFKNEKMLYDFTASNRNIVTRMFSRLKSALSALGNKNSANTETEYATERYYRNISDVFARALRETKKQNQQQSAEQFMLNSKERGGYNAFREILAKESLDELSVKLGDRFPLSANFDAVMRADDTPLVMASVNKGGVPISKKQGAFASGKAAFKSAYGNKAEVNIKQSGITVELWPDVVNESISKVIKRGNAQSIVDVIPHISQILENSILLGVERAAHTDNKGAALFVYRMYGLYEYTDGKTKAPRCLVCNVVQHPSKAEAYVFRDIEIVTTGQSLLGNKTDMSPTPNHGDTYSISQLYDFVKRVRREDGGLKYNESEKLKYLFNYSERNDGAHYSLVRDPERTRAIKMPQDGVSAKQVFDETGYFIDGKGRIRNDIEDTDGSDPAIRKPYPISRPSKALNEAREQIRTERAQHAAEMEILKEYKDLNEPRERLKQEYEKTLQWIIHPTKSQAKCPDFLVEPMRDLLGSIDISSKSSLAGKGETRWETSAAFALYELSGKVQRIKEIQESKTENGSAEDVFEAPGYLDLPPEFDKELQEMAKQIKAIATTVAAAENTVGAVIATMRPEQAAGLVRVLRLIRHSVSKMQELSSNNLFANVRELGAETVKYLDSLGPVKSTNAVGDFLKWDNALPFYAFKRLGKGGESIMESFMDSQDKLAMLADDIVRFSEANHTEKEARTWSSDVHTINLPSGNKLTLTSADAMSIYCLSEREAAREHLLVGGVAVVGKKKGIKKYADSHSNLTEEDIQAICDSLTKRQKEAAIGMRNYMATTCAEWGNEISMKRFLKRDYTEKKYFPMETSPKGRDIRDPDADRSNLFYLLNFSATKQLVPNANNELVIRNIFDVFAAHTSDMARMNAYGMALLDSMKWLNYRSRTINQETMQATESGVRTSMENAYGKEAEKYILTLIKDINGTGIRSDGVPLLRYFMKNNKISAVGANLRVALLQFTSWMRAHTVLEWRDMVRAIVPSRGEYEMAKEYCGIALWKSYGFFDTNISRNIESRMKGNSSKKEAINEKMMVLAAKADEVTLGRLWKACCYDVKRNGEYKHGSEDFYRAVGKKLREVIYSSQVVDSVLTRSQIMRKKDGLTQTATAFMSEPTINHNIISDLIIGFQNESKINGKKTAWKKSGKTVRRAVASLTMTTLAASLLESMADAWRDDDDEEFWKKVGENFLPNLLTNANPINNIPILSDFMSLIEDQIGYGYFSNDNIATTQLGSTVKTIEAWRNVIAKGEDMDRPIYYAIYNTTRAASQWFGLPLSNGLREVVALWNNTAGAYDPSLKVRTYESNATAAYEEMVKAGGDKRKSYNLVKELRSTNPETGRTLARLEVLMKSDVIDEAKVIAFTTFVSTADTWPAKIEQFMKAGGDFDDFLRMYRFNSVTTGEGRKDKIMAEIDKMNISDEQKDALYLMEYKETTLDDTPWHGGN